jgi:hypothetical protein
LSVFTLHNNQSSAFALSSKYSKDPTNHNKSVYTTYRNLYNSLVRAAKKLYFDREFEKHKSNLKKTWDLIKFAVNAEAKQQIHISELFVNGISHTDPLTIANELNKFFITAPQKIVSEIDVLVISGYDHFESEIFSIISSIQKLGLKLSSQFVYAPYHKSHHLFHAAKAFYSSGFDTALVVVQDGRGSYYNLNNGGLAFETTSVFSVSSDNKFDLIYRRFFTNSTVSDDTKIIWDNNFTQQKIDRPTYLNRQSKLEIRNDFDVG